MKNARELVLKVLLAVDAGALKSDRILRQALDESNLNPDDRAFATGIVYGVLRQRSRLDFIISRFYHHDLAKAAPAVRNILRIGVFQILFLDKVPSWAAVNECVRLARKYKGERMAKLTNGVLRKITPETVDLDAWLQEKTLPERLAVTHSHPQWLVERWLRTYGEEQCLSMLVYNNRPPMFGFRINRLKTTAESFFSSPLYAQAHREECGIDHFFVSRDFSPFESALCQGLLSVQNPTQALACLLLNPPAGSTVLDMCAAPGGKSTLIAEIMQNRGSVTALDLYEQKLRKLETRACELGITIIVTKAADARSYRTEKKTGFILLDAPCTGTGVLGRRAELRWRLEPGKVRELAALQAELLDNAADMLDDGGILVYATCSVEPEENELQVESFLLRHPEFETDADCSGLPETFREKAAKNGSILTLQGDRAGFDGGFCQRLRKNYSRIDRLD
jgi:16S rRNA (cytosine967-C5)-methyltransferase